MNKIIQQAATQTESQSMHNYIHKYTNRVQELQACNVVHYTVLLYRYKCIRVVRGPLDIMWSAVGGENNKMHLKHKYYIKYLQNV